MNIVRVLWSLAANFGWCLQQFDVMNVFLHGELKKALYGLKQSPRSWFEKFTKLMLAIQGDHTLFIEHLKGGVTSLLLYVDDIIITGNGQIERETLKKFLAKELKLKN
ncbi:Retrovirus-related Pol polyprotein from transposon TNT 1-94 [Gossypium australe]|uniref:Retrovirus-related Pol polyprotein from transposon TNT 1-94 n=1 Tax=Gossypium australe TaxID=47621 RepID=A0A5B6WEE5_9ROSI|nr:Retrovirus-related Pol polyprotein from transposon TNT 1-94 [Gossypium australe]